MPLALALDTRRHLFVGTVNGAGGRSGVRMVDSRTGATVRTTLVGRFVSALLVDARAERVLVYRDGDLYMLDARTGRTLRRIAGGGEPLAVDERAGHALISRRGHLRLIATADGAPLGPVLDGGVVAEPALVAGDEAAGRFYVATDRGLAVLDSHNGRLVRLLALTDSPMALAADAATHRLFLLSTGYPGPASADSWLPFVRWLRQALPWLPFPPAVHRRRRRHTHGAGHDAPVTGPPRRSARTAGWTRARCLWTRGLTIRTPGADGLGARHKSDQWRLHDPVAPCASPFDRHLTDNILYNDMRAIGAFLLREQPDSGYICRCRIDRLCIFIHPLEIECSHLELTNASDGGPRLAGVRRHRPTAHRTHESVC